MIAQELLLVKIIKLLIRFTCHVRLPKHVGHPYQYSVTVIISCLVVMVAKRLTVRGLYAFLTSKEDYQAYAICKVIPFPDETVPNRRTFDRRFTHSLHELPLVMLCILRFLIREYRLGIARLSLDNRMFAACGAIWHSKDQKQGIIPKGLRNVDITAGWGTSAYRGWVFGHGLDIIVTTGKLVLPILATARSLVVRGNTIAKSFVSMLPKVVKGVIAADSEYQDQELALIVRVTGRSLHTPSKRYPEIVPKSKTYQKRKITVEPCFERFLQAFVLRGKLDRKGPQAWPYLVACCLLYQLMVIYNLNIHKLHPLEVTHYIRML